MSKKPQRKKGTVKGDAEEISLVPAVKVLHGAALNQSKKRKASSSSSDVMKDIGGQIEPHVDVAALTGRVTLSVRDRANGITLSPDRMICAGKGGYRTIRATHGVHNGLYIWEAEILPPIGCMNEEEKSECHIRLGWSTRQAPLQAPVGYDKKSFGYRDLCGSRVHDGVRDDLYGDPFGVGDIIGCCIYLDDTQANNQIRFFKNGIDQGVAYNGAEIPLGIYYPAISLYSKARIRVNFGPSFILEHDIYGANAISELQPLSPEDRKVHEKLILEIRASRMHEKEDERPLDAGDEVDKSNSRIEVEDKQEEVIQEEKEYQDEWKEEADQNKEQNQEERGREHQEEMEKY